jgi:Domain of unknown function (DUF1929)
MTLRIRVSKPLVASACALAVFAALVGLSPAGAADGDAGSFGAPFSEPTVDGHHTEEHCVTSDHGDSAHKECKPAAGSMAVLTDGRVLYWNALEGTENIKNATAVEFGTVSINDQTRVLDLAGPTWSVPTPVDAGANPEGKHPDELIPGTASTETYNDGALFCADLVHLPDGRVLAIGGTQYYTEGAAELEGLPNSRIFDPETDTWEQTGSMTKGRWYPSAVTLADGDVFVASGVRKLLKPLYKDDPAGSGRNVVQTETYDLDSGTWTDNGPAAERSLPLYPRLHLLPNGHVFYNSGGQVFNPAGQSYDEATWNVAATYDPEAKAWTDLGIPGIGTMAPGFRGSTFSIMLPLRPDESGEYSSAEFLSAGGVYGVTPGSYFAHPFSTITTVDTADEVAMSTRETGSLNNSRWYSTGVLLPTGEVFAVSGASADEVVGPGTGMPVTQAELFDPATEEWRPVATQNHARTYHNTAMLLPDGSVLVGGHAPIPTLYGFHMTIPGSLFSPNEGRDPTFEIYKPWYFDRADRPEVTNISSRTDYGTPFNISIDGRSSSIESVVLVRNPSITHLIDGDQRSVELPIIKRAGHMLTVLGPPDGAVAPAGPYMLFVNRRGSDGSSVPSNAEQIFLGS